MEKEIEITPEMIEAGLEEFALFDSDEPGTWVICAVYRAMAKAAIKEDQEKPH